MITRLSEAVGEEAVSVRGRFGALGAGGSADGAHLAEERVSREALL